MGIIERQQEIVARFATVSALAVILGSVAALFAQAPTQQQQPEFVKQAQQLMKEGKPEAALAVYRQTPRSHSTAELLPLGSLIIAGAEKAGQTRLQPPCPVVSRCSSAFFFAVMSLRRSQSGL